MFFVFYRIPHWSPRFSLILPAGSSSLQVHCRERVLQIIPATEEREMSTLLCPACMVELKITDRQDVEIDYCPQCRGVWLDRGELDKIIDRSRSGTARRYEEYDDDDEERYRHGGARHRRRKSFLEDLFDFD
jgi:Zn-finger nucleic acid-binding protein